MPHGSYGHLLTSVLVGCLDASAGPLPLVQDRPKRSKTRKLKRAQHTVHECSWPNVRGSVSQLFLTHAQAHEQRRCMSPDHLSQNVTMTIHERGGRVKHAPRV